MKLNGSYHTMNDVPVAEVNTTPLIDVSLVLVVILLLATPLAFESSIAVRRGDPPSPPAVHGQAPDRVELAITGEDRVEVDGRALPVEQLAGALRPLLAPDARREVAVSCADDVSHGAFVHVLDIAKLSGAVTINVAEK